MGKSLCVFLFTSNVDVYVNAISCAYDKMDIDQLLFYHIEGTRTGLTRAEAVTVFNAISARFEDLYTRKVADIYRRIHERMTNRLLKTLRYNHLASDISTDVSKIGLANCAVDLTGAAKCPAIDIFSVCLALGLKSVYIFELADKADPHFPEKSLYHSLSDQQFAYSCLTDAPPVMKSQAALLRKRPLLWLVSIVASLLLALTLGLIYVAGINSPLVQIVNIVAAVVGIFAPLITMFSPRLESRY